MNPKSNNQSDYLLEIAMPFIAIITGLAFCYFASPIIVPVIIGISLAYVFYPAVKFLKRFRVPHLAAVLIVSVIVLIVFAAFSMLIYYQGNEFFKALPSFKVKAELFLENQMVGFQQSINNIFPDLIPIGEEDQIIDDFFKGLDYQSIGTLAFKGLGSIFSFLGNLIFVLIIAVFLLLEVDIFKRNLTNAFGVERKVNTSKIMTEINRQISSYFALKFIITVGLAIVYTSGLLIMGVDYAYIWGPLAAAISLVPIIGAYAGAVPPMIVAAIQYNSPWWVLWIFIFFMVVQFIESYIISPKLFSEQSNLNLTTVIVSTILWGWMWGMIGVILAVPMTAAVKIVCTHIEPLNPIAKILEGKIKY